MDHVTQFLPNKVRIVHRFQANCLLKFKKRSSFINVVALLVNYYIYIIKHSSPLPRSGFTQVGNDYMFLIK